MNTLMERIKKLPKEKQNPFLKGFKRLNEIEVLKQKILNMRAKIGKESDNLADNASVMVNKELFSRVLEIAKIGEGYKTDKIIMRKQIRPIVEKYLSK